MARVRITASSFSVRGDRRIDHYVDTELLCTADMPDQAKRIWTWHWVIA